VKELSSLIFLALTAAAIWWFTIRPQRNFEQAFDPHVPEYLALESAIQDVLAVAQIAPEYREQLMRDQVMRRNVLERQGLANQQKRSVEGPVVLVDTKARRVHASTAHLPDDLRPTEPASVRAVVWWDCETETVGFYSNGGGAGSVQSCAATLFDWRTKQWVAESTFRGGSPEQTIVNRKSDTGSMPLKELAEWLRGSMKVR
jgi:hypothetical protein